MATITLYKDKLNGVGSLIDTMVSSVNNLDMQLGALKATLQGVNSSTYNLDSAVENIRSSSQTEKEKADDLNKLSKEVDNFITVTVNRDNTAKEEINKAKEDFYTKYSYLKPECEKDFIEKVVDTVESAADWCCEHWKLIVTIVIVVVAVALLWTGVGGVLLAGACWGALSGAVIGGVAGGLTSVANGEGFLEGFEDGAFSGALSGAICGAAFAGLGQLGAVCGRSIKCASSFGKAIRGTAAVTKGISIAMGGFDTLALADLAFGSGTIYDLNSKLHSNKAYNIFQTGVSALAVFTGGMKATMKCFIAGTLIAAESGFARIESIKPGDVVLSTNADTMETGYKKVLEKYVRKTRELVHIIAGGEEIVSTPDHPYYVAGRGFVNACQLCIGSPLLDSDGKIFEIEQIYKEQLEKNEEVTVYNFQVEDWHTYHVGEMEVLVHNAEYESERNAKIYNSAEYKGTVKVNGEIKDVSRRVYQRNDIAFNYVDETTGLTNLERMQAGKPPIGSDGNPIQLHHILQKEVGPMVEIREITHQEYYSQLHGLIEDGASFRNNPVLNKQYNNFRRSYWKWRAEQIIGGN